MNSLKEQQIEICLLKSNLEEIENDLIVQRSAIPALDAENKKKYLETVSAFRIASSLSAEIERLKQENVRLTAKRMQLQRQAEDLNNALERTHRERSALLDSLRQEDDEIEQEIRKYEDSLRDLADRFRQTPAFYNEEEMKAELEMVKEIIIDLKDEEKRRQNELNELRNELDGLEADIPEDILTIVGKTELDEKMKSLSFQYDALSNKLDYLLKSQNNIAQLDRNVTNRKLNIL